MRDYTVGGIGALLVYAGLWWVVKDGVPPALRSGAAASGVPSEQPALEPAHASSPHGAGAHPGAAALPHGVAAQGQPSKDPWALIIEPSTPAPQGAARPSSSPGAASAVARRSAEPLPSPARPVPPQAVPALSPSSAQLVDEAAELRAFTGDSQQMLDRVQRFEPSPQQLAELRRVAAQFFEGGGSSSASTPWSPGGVRDGDVRLER